jgi:ABC-type transport system substrate-binding protein
MRTFALAAALVFAIALAAQAASTTLFTVPAGSYTGTINVPSSAVPVGATMIVASLDTSTATDPATSFVGSFDVSYDGGASWQFWSSAGYQGGVYLDKNGNPRTWSNYGGLDQPTNPSRRVRGTITITGTLPLGGGSVVAQ